MKLRKSLFGVLCLLPLAGALILSGCGGTTMSRPFIGAHESVEWVWEAPMRVIHAMFASGFAWSAVNDAAITDTGEVVVLTNYGEGFWYQRCNAFLLDIETGRKLGHVRGRSVSADDWYLNGRTVYVGFGWRNSVNWDALDLETGKMTSPAIPPRNPRRHVFNSGPHCGSIPSWFFLFPREYFYRNTSDGAWRRSAGRGREIVIEGTEVKLAAGDEPGREQELILCRLPRVCGHGKVLVHDERRLVFATGCYLICVDVRKLPARTATSQPADGEPGGTNGR